MFKNKNKGKVKIKKEKSGISEFIKRPLPSDEEVEEFEEVLNEVRLEEELDGEERDEDEIKDSLNEIYQDENGEMVDVSRLEIKKTRGIFYWIFSFIVTLSIMGGAGYGLYYYISNSGSDVTAMELSISANEEVKAGEEFFYEVDYKNLSKVGLSGIRLELSYPENFIFLDSLPLADEKNSIWLLDDLAARENGKIKIKGKIITTKDSLSKLSAKISYQPENFSSEFKKEATNTTSITDIGMNINLEYPTSVLAGYENEINIKLKPQDSNYINSFRIVLNKLENLEIIELIEEEVKEGEVTRGNDEEIFSIEKDDDNAWLITGFNEDKELLLKYKITDKKNDEEAMGIRFEQVEEIKKVETNIIDSSATSTEPVKNILIREKKYFLFFKEEFNIEVMKSDLNLTLLINGSKNDKAVDFGEKLNYSIVFTNKGETNMKDVVIMAVLDSDFLDWTSLKEKNNGSEKGNTISWSKEEIPELEDLGMNEEGIIDFSISLKSLEDKTSSRNYSVKSYVQFNVGDKVDADDSDAVEEDEINEDNRSNAIINKINSDLKLNQEIRYFSSDNIPVGNGPLPPKVGEVSSFKVYWTITNNIHELYDAKVEVKLPEYINWDNKERTSVGSIKYNSGEHKVIWQIGRLPVSVYRADAEFNISLEPEENDRNKIMVLAPGAIVSATDNETGGEIMKTTSPKTTKLEDDEIASISSDGRVE